MTKANEVPLPDLFYLRTVAEIWFRDRFHAEADVIAAARAAGIDPTKALARMVAEKAVEYVLDSTGGGNPRSMIRDEEMLGRWSLDLTIRAIRKAARAVRGKTARKSRSGSRANAPAVDWLRIAADAAAKEKERQDNLIFDGGSGGPGATRDQLLSGFLVDYGKPGTVGFKIVRALEREPGIGLDRLREIAFGSGVDAVLIEKAALRILKSRGAQTRALRAFFQSLEVALKRDMH